MRPGYTTPLVIAIMAFAIVAFLFLIDTAIMPANSNQATNRTTNTNTNISTDTSPTVDIPTDDWKTFSDTSTGVSIHYPQDWQEKSCGDAMIVYFAPEEISCGAGLNAIGLQRTTSDQTVSAAIANRQTQVEQTTVLQLTVADRDAQRLIGSDPQSALGGSETQQNDEIYFRQDDFLWSLSSTLEDDGRIFLAMADTLTLSKPATTDPAAGWKTYTNTRYGFTLQYPDDWKRNEDEKTLYGALFQISRESQYGSLKEVKPGFITINVIENPGDKSLQELFNDQYASCLTEPNNELGCPGPSDTTKWKKVTIDGKSGLQGSTGQIIEGYSTYIKIDGVYLQIGTAYYPESAFDFVAALKEIVATIKFTD